MVQSLLAALVLVCCSSYSNAQQATTRGQTGDIIVLGNGWTGTISPCTHYVDCWAGSTDTGDIHEAQNTGNGTTYYWSGTQQTLTNTIALNTALQAVGIQIDGFDYEWVFKNGNANTFSGQTGGGAVDPFEIVVNVYDSNSNLYKSYKYDYGNQFYNWTTKTGTELFGAIGLDPTYFGNVVVEVTAQDIANQAGYWGPEFRADESGLYVNYSADPCYNNQTYDPACPGYAQALYNQQCVASPLYDPGCPGYQAAWLSMQCAANPLIDPTCPGYSAAYYNQQCKLNPLYDSQCPGYATAYLNQQCSLNPLYDSQCNGYSLALFNNTCTNNPTSDPACPDYYVAKCEENPLFDRGCTGYDIAYFDEQCSLDAQYSQTCPGYVDLSGNDNNFAVLDPVVEDVLSIDTDLATGQPDFYQPEITATSPTFSNDVVEAPTEEVQQKTGFQTIDDSIEVEIAELESLDGEATMDDDIDSEIAALENSSEEASGGGPLDARQGGANQEDNIEKELAALENSKPDYVENIPGKAMPKVNPVDSKREKMRLLIAMKAIETVKELEAAVTLEQQMDIQRRLLALISFVPDFNDYGKEENIDLANFYPPKPTVDHAYARWFLNDPNFGAMEDLQYNFK